MRCRLCQQPAGWFRRSCPTCDRLAAIVEQHRGAGFGAILDRLMASGASRPQVEAFLTADPDGRGCARDRIAADMTNELMNALGQTGRQSAADVKRARERGQWVGYDQPPRT